ncbi:hypothetical protein NIES806_08270 [Dolichospermum compactum NIES-806]|uniref:Uncharacterized protein n=1 Tax=Dolichospermum compactum NIES-806 TaxID=1973481 RepID=A0A1Z4UZG3_9CYAN|nr:hypothetical protein NIES806_08270 [Dolichospermum compactum NIES-806]
MSYENIRSDLLVELSTEEQQLLSGGQRPGRQRPIICTRYRPYKRRSKKSSGTDIDIDVDIDDSDS